MFSESSKPYSFFDSYFSSGHPTSDGSPISYFDPRPQQAGLPAGENGALHLHAGAASGLIHANTAIGMPHSYPQDDSVSKSPAAMFLSSFSPPSAATTPDAEGMVIAGHTLGSIIGYGGFSTIRRASCPSGGFVAVKIVRRTDLSKQRNPSLARRRLDHEAAVWASLSHEHILPLFSSAQTPYADFFFTLFCPAGSLFDILKRDGRPALPQDDAGMMFRQVVRGLRYMHEVAESVHRDMKLENVLVDEMGVCKIGDFGMTRKIGEIDDDTFEEGDDAIVQSGELHRATSMLSRKPKSGLPDHLAGNVPRHRNSTPTSGASTPQHVFQPGSLPYASPELLLPQSSSAPLGPQPAQDIWALGVVLYALLTGRLPFMDSFEPRLQMKILHGVYDVPSDIGRGAERVLQGCLERSVATRWTIDMVDDVAWGVGWGTAGDDVSPIEEEEEGCSKTSTPRSLPGNTVISNRKHDSERKTPASEAAERRSSSRAQRSRSRAPVLTRSSSSARSVHRSISRSSSPSFSALNSSILRTLSDSSSLSSPEFHDSALATSPASSLERGRRRMKSYVHSASRSSSPSVLPTTPIDLDIGKRSLERSRGRRPFGLRTPHREHFDESELDVLEEALGWTSSSKPGAASTYLLHADYGTAKDDGAQYDREEHFVQLRKGRRVGSTPPAPSSPGYEAASSRFLNAVGGTILVKDVPRSRSVGSCGKVKR